MLKTPDISKAQLAAIATFLVSQLVAYGVIDDNQKAIVLSLGGAAVAAAWKLADAWIRYGRSRAIAAPPREPTKDVVV